MAKRNLFNALGLVLLFCVWSPLAGGQGHQPAGQESPTERWERMTPEQHKELKQRFKKLQKMSPEERAEMKVRSKQLRKEREGLEKGLDPKLRKQLRGMSHAERNNVLREHQLGERRLLGQKARENLSPGRSGWLDSLVGPGHPRPFHELRDEVRGKVEKHVLDKLGVAGDIDPEERARIEGLPPKQRTNKMLELHRARIEMMIEKDGLPDWVPPGKWAKLKGEPEAKRFMGNARKLGLDLLAPPPGKQHPDPLVQELGDLLRPTIEDRLAIGKSKGREDRKLMDERVGARVRVKLADPTWLPNLDRTGLLELSNGSLVRKLRKLLPWTPHVRPR